MKTPAIVLAFAWTFLFAGSSLADPPDQTAPTSTDQPGHVSPAPNTQSSALSAVKDAASVTVGAAAAEVTNTAQGFVSDAAITDMYEIEAGKIAEQRSHNADVQAFAREMIAAHTKSSEELRSILPTSGTDASIPAHLDDRRQGLIDDLRGAKNKDFDAEYMSQQVDVHREALILMTGYAKNGDVTALKDFAAKTAPIVQKHLDVAKHLYNVIG